jgi:hypothetical protein
MHVVKYYHVRVPELNEEHEKKALEGETRAETRRVIPAYSLYGTKRTYLIGDIGIDH